MGYNNVQKRLSRRQSSFSINGKNYHLGGAGVADRFMVVFRKKDPANGAGIYGDDHFTVMDTVTGKTYTASNTKDGAESAREQIGRDFVTQTGFFEKRKPSKGQKAHLNSIQKVGNRIYVELLVTPAGASTRFAVLDGLATKLAKQYLIDHKIHVRRWAKVDGPHTDYKSESPNYVHTLVYELLEWDE